MYADCIRFLKNLDIMGTSNSHFKRHMMHHESRHTVQFKQTWEAAIAPCKLSLQFANFLFSTLNYQCIHVRFSYNHGLLTCLITRMVFVKGIYCLVSVSSYNCIGSIPTCPMSPTSQSSKSAVGGGASRHQGYNNTPLWQSLTSI